MDAFTRLLALTGADEPQALLSKRRSFELLLILGIVSEAWRQHARALFAPGGAALADWLPLLLASALALVALKLRWRRAGLAALLLLQLFASGLLLFLPGDANRRALPLFAALYAWMLLTSLRVLPEVGFY